MKNYPTFTLITSLFLSILSRVIGARDWMFFWFGVFYFIFGICLIMKTIKEE